MAVEVIEPFRVERWMDEYEESALHNIAETCAASISIDDICSYAGIDPTDLFVNSKKLTYGSIRGSEALRSNLAGIYNERITKPITRENILLTNGAIGANFAVLYSLIGKGDHVICQHPTYQQLYSVPRSLGAEVTLWKTTSEKGWEIDVRELEGLIKTETKMIILNNPQNPTGKVITKSVLSKLSQLAKRHDLYLFVDEVYLPLIHGFGLDDPEYPLPALHWEHDKIVSTGSMSKAFSLAGIRLGWIASRSQAIIEACAGAREYTMISVSQLDDRLATIATSQPCIQNIINRNIELARTNLSILDSFIDNSGGRCEYVKPRGGTTAMVKFSRDGRPVDDVAFCKAAHIDGVFMVPGNHCFADGSDFRGHVRIGYVCSTKALQAGLKVLEDFMHKAYEEVPLAA